MAPDTNKQTLHLPRILCLHGGGTNARIFRAQCRVLEPELKSEFRFCYAEAPFPSQAGPDVLSVYSEYGPFKCWAPWLPGNPVSDDNVALEIDESLNAAMDEDDDRGATGEWVGLLGFSQGAKICASLLLRQQLRAQRLGKYNAGSNFRFAALLAGSAPMISLEPRQFMRPEPTLERNDYLLHIPTIHVHGMQDPGIDRHRKLVKLCAPESVKLVEWDGNHRIPFKHKDVALVVDQIIAVARNTGL